MNLWTDILTAEQIEASHAATAKLDPAFAKRDREFYRARTANELRALAAQAWTCCNADSYQMARSYLALA